MKSTIKRTISYIMAAVLALTMTCTPAFAEEVAVTEEPAVSDILISDEVVTDPAGTDQDNDELFMLYVEERLEETVTSDSETSETSVPRLMRKQTLTGINAAIYTSLKGQIKQVADGASNTAVFTVGLDEFGLEKNSWTAAELGVDAIARNGIITSEAKNALTNKLGISMRTVITSLLFDCPYDLYWYDKEKGISISGPGISAEQVGGQWTIRVSSGLVLYFTVADGYSTGNDYEVDTSRVERVNHAVDKAAAIVEAHLDETDHGKLVSYKEEICDLVEYDNDAAVDYNTPYGDPWQVISVFDEDETTNVVCEGYSKAFQYLCDLTEFEGNISCISVDGYMDGGTGSGAHMWNIVCMGDGTNLLVDVTNCDTGTIGEPDQLFLTGYTSGDVEAGYSFSCIGGTIRYIYDSDTTSTFDTELVLAPKGVCIHDLVKTEGVPATCTEGGIADYWTCTICGNMYGDPDAVTAITEAGTPTEPLGHDWGEWTVTVRPSIHSEGTEQRICSRDASHKEERTVPAIVIDSVYRIYGSTRFETSLLVADDLKEKLGLDKFGTVILAYGQNYADALAGSYLSCLKTAPILLVDGRQDHIKAVQEYIKANLDQGGTIYMLGGSAVVPDAAVSGLTGYSVKRLWGSDRYATNLEILKEAGLNGSEILVASGNSFADSLSAAAAGRPVLLTKQSLNDSQKQYLRSLGGSANFVIIGGTGAVSEGIKDELSEYGTTERVGGSTRYETSVNVARRFFEGPKTAVLAYGQTFPDGLCGGALAYTINGPLILAAEKKTEFAEAYAAENGIHYGAVLGGPALISDVSADAVFGWGPVSPETAVYRNITYVLNGGENSASNPDQYAEGDTIRLSDPTRDNYSFCGWYLDKKYTRKIVEIPRNTKGDITIYAKWHLAPLNIQGEGMEDMIWSWWYYPQVVSSESGDVFWGYATKDGHCGVAKYDQTTGRVMKTALKLAYADDHNGLALTLLDDGRVMAVYAGGHNTDNEIHVRISDASGDISRFSTDTVLESSGKTCYSQIIRSRGRYYIFYRVNNNKWAFRSSEDLKAWSDETILVTAPMQYYCKFEPTTQDNIIRVLMYSNPTKAAPEIRLGFFDTSDDSVYNGDAFSAGQTLPEASCKLVSFDNQYTSFITLLDPPEGKTQRLLDCAVTEPGRTEFLYTTFSKKTGANDSVYYVYDSGSSFEICEGGKPLMDYNYQLGASFIDPSAIVAARNINGTDKVELYTFDGTAVTADKTLDAQTGTANSRNARPIVDVNKNAILWHNGYYNNKKYTDFDTSARLYLSDSDTIVMNDPEKGTSKLNDSTYMADDPDLDENVSRVNAYADRLYNENKLADYRHAKFTWAQEQYKRGWLYYNGFMLEAFLTSDPSKYSTQILDFYDQHVVQDENTGKYIVWNYLDGSLDCALTAVGMVDLIRLGLTDEDRTLKYSQAINYVYNQLENQTSYPDAGNLYQHGELVAQTEIDGETITTREPSSGWSKWNTCLDGVYMSNLFLIRLAEIMDAGLIEIYSEDGMRVGSSEIWSDVNSRLTFVMENMRNPNTGLLWHGYSVADKECNGVTWSRGMGWFAMTLMEAAEKMPDGFGRNAIRDYFSSLMTSIIEWQDPATDLWYNVTDRKSDLVRNEKVNQPETSGSAMFSFCLLKGYNNGLLEGSEFRESGLKAFNSLAKNRLSEEGLTDTLLGMGCSRVPSDYLKSVIVTNEAKGIAAFIMAAKYAY